jgi:effector-binding domain-containing protein
MKALKIIVIIILLLLALFFLIALFLPKNITMTESITINKPASLVFKQLNNYRNWTAWSPWQATDPEMVSAYEGPQLGVGAKTTWTSKKHGNGSLTTTESIPYKRVAASLDFGQGSEALNFFDLEEGASGTKVTWGVSVPDMGYPIGRYIAAMMPGMMKPFFMQGLEKLKEVTESMPDPPALKIVEMPEMKVVTVLDSCGWADIEAKMGEMFGELMNFTSSAKAEQAGYPLSMYHKWDEVNQFTVFENAIPVNRELTGKGRIQFKVMPATRAVLGVHFGAYDKTYDLYMAMDEFVAEFGLETSSGPIEEYVTDPMTEPDTSKWQTNIYFPVK